MRWGFAAAPLVHLTIPINNGGRALQVVWLPLALPSTFVIFVLSWSLSQHVGLERNDVVSGPRQGRVKTTSYWLRKECVLVWVEKRRRRPLTQNHTLPSRKLSSQEKVLLGTALPRLSPEHLIKALQIVHENNSNFQPTAEVVELDINSQVSNTFEHSTPLRKHKARGFGYGGSTRSCD
ncbi:Transcription factor GTE1 [Stylosanthes scabra]|uniref:Transcription factor GTE1 n=1 Tax=Stylosanthes scabra TaxID=79078 RepID=A0ABU6QD40_9FABA|nr:Transcription factor GTE1 [Stylosanthes scabra]